MEITFYSLDDENNKVFFKSKGIKENNIISFIDKSNDNTTILLEQNTSSIIFYRKGDIDMKMILEKNIINSCYYKNQNGLEFDFKVYCKELIIKEKRIDIEYDMILDEDIISSHKIWIKIA